MEFVDILLQMWYARHHDPALRHAWSIICCTGQTDMHSTFLNMLFAAVWWHRGMVGPVMESLSGMHALLTYDVAQKVCLANQ